jgi:hypothetical protein
METHTLMDPLLLENLQKKTITNIRYKRRREDIFAVVTMKYVTLRGWHPQPIIAAGIRKFQGKNSGMKTRLVNIVILKRSSINGTK